MSENANTHDKLVEFGVLAIMVHILKESKDAKLHCQVFFLSLFELT